MTSDGLSSGLSLDRLPKPITASARSGAHKSQGVVDI